MALLVGFLLVYVFVLLGILGNRTDSLPNPSDAEYFSTTAN